MMCGFLKSLLPRSSQSPYKLRTFSRSSERFGQQIDGSPFLIAVAPTNDAQGFNSSTVNSEKASRMVRGCVSST